MKKATLGFVESTDENGATINYKGGRTFKIKTPKGMFNNDDMIFIVNDPLNSSISIRRLNNANTSYYTSLETFKFKKSKSGGNYVKIKEAAYSEHLGGDPGVGGYMFVSPVASYIGTYYRNYVATTKDSLILNSDTLIIASANNFVVYNSLGKLEIVGTTLGSFETEDVDKPDSKQEIFTQRGIDFLLKIQDFEEVNISGEDMLTGFINLPFVSLNIRDVDINKLKSIKMILTENSEAGSFGSLQINSKVKYIAYIAVLTKDGEFIEGFYKKKTIGEKITMRVRGYEFPNPFSLEGTISVESDINVATNKEFVLSSRSTYIISSNEQLYEVLGKGIIINRSGSRSF